MNLEDYFDMLRKMSNSTNPEDGETKNGKKSTNDSNSDDSAAARSIS